MNMDQKPGLNGSKPNNQLSKTNKTGSYWSELVSNEYKEFGANVMKMKFWNVKFFITKISNDK